MAALPELGNRLAQEGTAHSGAVTVEREDGAVRRVDGRSRASTLNRELGIPEVYMADRAVFINYRGEDSHSYGALLYNELKGRLGEEFVFLDAESIPAGADFVEVLLARVRSARVLLAVIGPRWLTATDSAGRRRIDDPADWIRRELAEAFAAGVRVIPVLTDHAEPPKEADLPADIVALSRCQYRRLRCREPTSDLARIVADLTGQEPALAAAARSRDNIPRQLPAMPGLFVGRDTELAALTDTTTTTPRAETTAVISAIAGAGGIGKTWLALTWAHRNVHRFPDGQLVVDLRGFSPGEPRTAMDVLADFISALGVNHDCQPQDLDARIALYRTRTAGRRMLILLDNAASTEQVVPLLPGGTTCTVLITSRNRLPALLSRHGARPVHLDVFSETEARTLLTDTLGHVSHDMDTQRAITELIGLCGGFPLALGLIVARVRTCPELLLDLVTDLRDLGLDALDSADPTASLPTVLSWSLRYLTDEQRTLFGLLGIVPGPYASLPAVICLRGLPAARTRAALSTLEEASLVERRPGTRYVMHDLVRDYSTTVARELSDGVREAALARVLDFHLQSAHAADRLLNPHARLRDVQPPAPGVEPLKLSDAAAALAWLEAEHANLMATQRAAVALGHHLVVWHLAWAMRTFHIRRGHWHDALVTRRAALEAAAHLSDPTIHGPTHRLLGHALSRVGRHEEAISHLHQALDLAMRHGDSSGLASTHQHLALAWGERGGQDRRALDHARHARDIYRAADRPILEADALNAMGWFNARLGDFDTAAELCRAALILNRSNNYPDGAASALDSLGFIAHRCGEHRQAISEYYEALALRRTLGYSYQVADTLDSVGHPFVALGRHERARAAWQEAVELYRDQGRDSDAERVQRQLDELDDATDREPDGR